MNHGAYASYDSNVFKLNKFSWPWNFRTFPRYCIVNYLNFNKCFNSFRHKIIGILYFQAHTKKKSNILSFIGFYFFSYIYYVCNYICIYIYKKIKEQIKKE